MVSARYFGDFGLTFESVCLKLLQTLTLFLTLTLTLTIFLFLTLIGAKISLDFCETVPPKPSIASALILHCGIKTLDSHMTATRCFFSLFNETAVQ